MLFHLAIWHWFYIVLMYSTVLSGPYPHLISGPSDQDCVYLVKVLRMGAVRKQLAAAGAEMKERQTAQREAIGEASKSRGESGQEVNQGDN